MKSNGFVPLLNILHKKVTFFFNQFMPPSPPQYLLKILWFNLQYATIQYAIFKPSATSKIELFVAEIR